MPEGGKGQGDHGPQVLGKSVNPIPTWGRLCLPHLYSTTGFSDLPTVQIPNIKEMHIQILMGGDYKVSDFFTI